MRVACREPKPCGGLESSEKPQVMFLDLVWGGRQGQVTYPPFVNGKAVTAVKRPDGQLILRDHDTNQLTDTLQRYHERHNRWSSTNALHRASVHAHVCKNGVMVSPLGHVQRRKQANSPMKGYFKTTPAHTAFSKC